jgi:calcineurin-like phosphoesterase
MSDLKHIDEIYKDWCGEHHTTNSCHQVHDSAEACDFAEYYHKIVMEANEAVKETGKALNLPDINNNEVAVCNLTTYEECKKIAGLSVFYDPCKDCDLRLKTDC